MSEKENEMEITCSELVELLENQKSSGATHSLAKGQTYLIRTITMYYTGRLVQVTDSDLMLEDAAWIPDTGRFSDCLRTGEFSEVEPFLDPVIVIRANIIDISFWNHSLPVEKK